MKKQNIFLILFSLLLYFGLIYGFVSFAQDSNLLITIVVGIILFFVVIGIAAAIYDYFDNADKFSEKTNLRVSETQNYNHTNNKDYSGKNHEYETKKKHRKRYYREHVNKSQKQHEKGLANREERYERRESSGGTKVWEFIAAGVRRDDPIETKKRKFEK